MKRTLIIILLLSRAAVLFGQQTVLAGSKQKTICNPLNLSYRFCLDTPSRREAADPTMVTFKGEYYLFASKSGGYWHSANLISWNLITTADLPLEDYAPTAVAIGDTLYFTASSSKSTFVIYKTASPKSGKWQVKNAEVPIAGVVDPCLFLDENGRLYFYFGCSNVNPIYGVELDRKTFNPIGKPIALFNSHMEINGWERKGDYNQVLDKPWMEGSWMNKFKGKYYLQYAAPGTQFKSYCDGVYIADSPLGPFKIAANNPASAKPEGFIDGAGHSSTFQDKYGNYWHISTMTISVKHMFERRLGLFPAFFDHDGNFSVYTGFGDFPYQIPQKKITDINELSPGWMLLSYHKKVEVSSQLPGYDKDYITDEDIRKYWSAKTGQKGEWACVDLGQTLTVNAVQINFAENQTKILGRDPSVYYQYLLEYSTDKKVWHIIADKRNGRTDAPHDYLELLQPVKARYVRLTNYHVPDGTFALSGLRVFGTAGGSLPGAVGDFIVMRNANDPSQVNLQWEESPKATGYNIRYGTSPDKLYHNYQVLDAHHVTINSLNAKEHYYFAIDPFNESGVSRGTKVTSVP